MARIDFYDVGKVYRSQRKAVYAVRDFNLGVSDGEWIGLLGPGGCGKTSLLRMIAGLENISSGEIHFDGVCINPFSPAKRNVALLRRGYALHPRLSVADNLGFALQARGVVRSARRSQVRRIAELLRLEQVLERLPPSLSERQQQRVGLGRALIRAPSVLLLDEVLHRIDPQSKWQMLLDLKHIRRDFAHTTIFATHDPAEALALADRIAVMNDARLQQAGTRDELYHSPANVFVADFVGELPTNFFAAQWRWRTGELRSTRSELIFQAGEAAGAGLGLVGQRQHAFTVAIRPQHLFLRPAGGSRMSAIAGEVIGNEYLGAQTILTVRNGGDEFRVSTHPHIAPLCGDRITLYYRPRDVMVFDRTGAALTH